jgi:hypothetical protein
LQNLEQIQISIIFIPKQQVYEKSIGKFWSNAIEVLKQVKKQKNKLTKLLLKNFALSIDLMIISYYAVAQQLRDQTRLFCRQTPALCIPWSPQISHFLPAIDPMFIAYYAILLHTKFQKNQPCLQNPDQIQICFIFILARIWKFCMLFMYCKHKLF